MLIDEFVQFLDVLGAGRGRMLRLLGVQPDLRRGFLDGLHGARARNTAARAGHALEQVAVVLARLCRHHHLAAFAQAFGIGDLDLAVRVFLLDDIDYRLRHAARDRKVTAVRRGVVDAVRVFRQRLQINMACIENTGHFLKGEHEVHLTAHVLAHRFQLLCRAGADKGNLRVRMVMLNQACGQCHGRQRHGDAFLMLREQLFRHGRPRRAARSTHKRQLFRHLLDKVLRLLRGAQVGADGNLEDIRKAQLLHRRAQLARRDLGAELADKRRRDRCVNALARLDGADHLEDLGLVRNGAERAVDQAHAARNALVVINIRLAVLIAVDRVHAAGHGARTLLPDDSVVRADVDAAPALDALFLVDVRTAVEAVEPKYSVCYS